MSIVWSAFSLKSNDVSNFGGLFSALLNLWVSPDPDVPRLDSFGGDFFINDPQQERSLDPYDFVEDDSDESEDKEADEKLDTARIKEFVHSLGKTFDYFVQDVSGDAREIFAYVHNYVPEACFEGLMVFNHDEEFEEVYTAVCKDGQLTVTEEYEEA